MQAAEESTEASQDSDSSKGEVDQKEEKPTERNLLLFTSSSNFIKQWNNFIIILAMYNSMLIPLQIFYKQKAHSALVGHPITMIDAIVDLLFLIDIIITFRTTYLDPKLSLEVRDPHKIGKRYIKGALFIDLISSVPFTSLFKTEAGAA